MKQPRSALDLAAALTVAAQTPPPLPQATVTHLPERASPKAKKKESAVEKTVATALRPKESLLSRYTAEAGQRTLREGRVISAQQVMLEILEKNAP